VMSVLRGQCLAFDGSVFSVMTTTFALAAIWKENTTVIMPFYDMPICSRKGMHLHVHVCDYHRSFVFEHQTNDYHNNYVFESCHIHVTYTLY
jgi:hypothetical protein